jgi:hypothetical protein
MSLMIMVRNLKNAGTTDYDPEVQKSDILYREVEGEREMALSICDRILKRQRWTWAKIENEIQKVPDGGWNMPHTMS